MKNHQLALVSAIIMLSSCNMFWGEPDSENLPAGMDETIVEQPAKYEEEVDLINKFVEIEDGKYVLDESSELFQDMDFNYFNVSKLKEKLTQLNSLIQKDLQGDANVYVYMFDQFGNSKLVSNVDGNSFDRNNIAFTLSGEKPISTRATVYASISGNREANFSTTVSSVVSKGQISTNQKGFLYGWLECETGYTGAKKNTTVVFSSPYVTYQNITLTWRSNDTVSPYDWSFFFGVGGNNTGNMTFQN
ncbi:MAG: hypothetical protein AB2L20_07425 [Mangrovibacterium sp.]